MRRGIKTVSLSFLITTGAFSQSACAFCSARTSSFVAHSSQYATTSQRIVSRRNNGRRLNRGLASSFSEDDQTFRITPLEEPATIAESITIDQATGDALTEGDAITRNERISAIKDAIAEKVGTVDESRLAFPELSTREVPRLYSSLKYEKDEITGKIISSKHAPGSVLGAAALIAGTTVGASVLALPEAVAPVGFLPSSAAFIGAWVYMGISGLLLAELCINRIGETGRPGVGVLEVYKNSLDRPWTAVGMAAYFFLHYSVLVAYIAQGGVNLSNILDSIGLDSVTTLFPGIEQTLFAGTAGSLIYFARPQMMEKINTFLVVAMMATFIAIVGIAAQTADFHSLIAPVNQHPDQVVNALPILFLSLLYQNVVPTVVKQLEGDRRKIQKAIIVGTLVPLTMFLVWNAVILGNVYAAGVQDAMAAGTLDPIAMLQGAGQGSEALGPLFEAFSEVAITTSLIGFVYSLLDAITDVTGLPSEGSRFERFKPFLFGVVFIPPFALSLASPDIFYDALDFGGAFGVSTLFLLLPGIMVWKERYGDEQGPISTKAMVPGGKITLGSLWKTAGVLIFEQGAEKLGLFDFVRDTFS
eukprot:scaffold44591_cov54-Attheya_sp.AAC.6